MNQEHEPSVGLKIVAGIAVLISALLAGALLGGVWVRLFVEVDSGFGGIADVLGGLTVGGLIGLIAAGIMIAFLSIRTQWIAAVIGIVLTVLIVVGLRLTAPPQASQPEPPREAVFDPFYRVNLNINHADEILLDVPAV